MTSTQPVSGLDMPLRAVSSSSNTTADDRIMSLLNSIGREI